MSKHQVPNKLSQLAFEFFYWFSRFEFCLKENGYLKSEKAGDRAEPGWGAFVGAFAQKYELCAIACELLAAPPDRQVVGANKSLDWRPLRFDSCGSDLEKVVLSVKTVRNNLFHGGKHGAAGWDDPQRTHSLITLSYKVLENLVELADFRADYERRY
ncbi:hypothetical protein ACF8FG_17845 [Pseudomonas sp. YQ_6]|uniref:hypothetical protein n=1 Tax=Pseudomonas sp. YQ_6 TaxID=3367230 RepID=UPI00370C49B0